jgi:glycosyltransferase involved in cell wall biosynthesis
MELMIGKTSLRVVLDCRSIHPHMGGIGRAAWDFAMALAAKRDGTPLTLLIGPRAPSSFNPPNVHLVQVDAAMIDERFDQLHLPVILERLHADFYFNTTFSIPAVKTTKFQGAIIHDVVFEEKPEWVEPSLREYLSKWSHFTAENADRVVTVSEDSKSRIVSAYKIAPERIWRIYNGLHENAFIHPPQAEIATVRDRLGLVDPYILYLGTLEPKKGVGELIAAFEMFAVREATTKLVLAGPRNGFSPELDRRIAASGVRSRIVQLGYVEEGAKKALIGGSRLFVFPSLYEGFGLPPLEAMALGIPCVTSCKTSLPEIVGDAAMTMDVRDDKSFADALERGLSDENYRKEASIKGPARARQFTWAGAAQEFLKLCAGLEAA